MTPVWILHLRTFRPSTNRRQFILDIVSRYLNCIVSLINLFIDYIRMSLSLPQHHSRKLIFLFDLDSLRLLSFNVLVHLYLHRQADNAVVSRFHNGYGNGRGGAQAAPGGFRVEDSSYGGVFYLFG